MVEFGIEQAGSKFFLKSEAFTFDIDRDRMVEQAVKNGAGNDGIAEHLAPGTQALVAGDDDRAALIAP